MKRRIRYPARFQRGFFALVLILLILNLLFPPPIDAARAVSPVVTDKNGQWLSGFSVEDGKWRVAANIEDIDPRFIERLIAIEDKRFYQHSGVDVPAIIRALRSWQREGEIVSGASTITMQLVRQIESRPRTFRSKFVEMLRAVQYEVRLSKTEIIELYLSHISYGGNIEGVYAASQIYLGKPPLYLTDAEIALLIALPQAPEARRPDLRSEIARTARNEILEKLAQYELMSNIAVSEAAAESVPHSRHAMPERAWMAAHKLKNANTWRKSNIDGRLQTRVEELAAKFTNDLEAPSNVAVLVIENEDRAVRAHIGSADRLRSGGWINMTDRARSPGSTLKPLIYGIAMDDGLIAPGSEIMDRPTRFGSYQPENFNRRYHGRVQIDEALQHSLNVPAIAVLDQLGDRRFEASIKDLGLSVTKLGGDHDGAGLAIGLGGVGMTLEDLAVIYGALATDGMAQNLRWTPDDVTSSRRLVSRATAAKITQILRQAPTPDGRVPAWLAQNAPPIAYKTGTSYGFRDAWAAGYTEEYTVIVWVGRPDGAPRIGETGRSAAAPFLFDVFAALPQMHGNQVFQRADDAPKGLKSVQDYTQSGPQILFPPDGAELLATSFGDKSRGFALSARGETSGVRLYVENSRIAEEDGRHVWRPEAPGFYQVKAVDDLGRTSYASVEVISFDQLTDAPF